MSGINLLNSESQGGGGFVSENRAHSRFLPIVVGLVALEILALAGILIWSKVIDRQVTNTKQEIAQVGIEIEGLNEQRMAAVSAQRRLRSLQGLLREHLYWSQAFQELENFTHQASFYDDLQGSFLENKLILSGTSPSFTDMAKLMRGLEQSPHISDVVLQSTNVSTDEQGGFSFRIEATFDEALIRKGS